MPFSLPSRLTSPEVRTGSFYFTLFLTAAVANPFLPIWLDDLGISASQIGIINAVPILIMIALNLAVGRAADRAKDWRSVIVAGALLGAVAPFALLFVDGFWGILIVWTLIIVPFQAIAPVTDAAALHLTRRRGSDFASIRVWGTIGFIVATIAGGIMLDWYGALVFVPMIIAVNLLRAGVSLQLPRFRGREPAAPREKSAAAAAPPADPVPPATATAGPGPAVARTIRETWKPWYMLTLVGAALLHSSHMLQMGFGALIWREAGIPPSVIGPLWAVAPVCEVFAMLLFARMSRRFSARHLLLASCLIGAVRWMGFAFDPGVVEIAVLQTLHMASFGLGYMGIVNFIANWTSDSIAAEAQSSFVVIRQIGNVAALAGFGLLVGGIGMQAYIAAAGVSLVGGVMIAASLMMMKTRQ